MLDAHESMFGAAGRTCAEYVLHWAPTLFADLREARHLRSNPAISPGALQQFERKASNRLIDYFIKLLPLPSDD